METKTKIICFGETLWDVFPEGAKIGGAPLNVAYHLQRLGLESNIISRIGSDDWGERLIQQVKNWGISTDTLQKDSIYDTSTVLANVQYDGETTYDIVKPVAWDFIEWKEAYKPLIKAADAVVFGSLAFRSATSRTTLSQLIEEANFLVFDVNLRPPHYTGDQIIEMLSKTHLLKVNEEELATIAGWLGLEKESEANQVQHLKSRFSIEEVLVTKGRKGALYFSNEECIKVDVFPVKVINTVGSGDAFLAAFLSEKFGNSTSTPQQQLEKAALLGAFVAGKDGACPHYDENDLQRFKG